ncbi:MAG: mechanosensitive ion channel domain-containing protein [Venatoribacter sp.]
MLDLEHLLSFLNIPQVNTALALAGLVLFSLLVDLLIKKVLLRVVFNTLRLGALKDLVESGRLKFISWLSHIIPAVILSEGVRFITDLPESLGIFISNLAQGFVVVMLALSANQIINLTGLLYERRPDSGNKPIKGYLQILKIAIVIVSIVFIIALLVNRSPVFLISGLGAMAAVLMLVFQNTLLSLVASVQISSGQLIRIGDWIEMKQQNADGAVIDIALHTVKIQNWDKTITAVPTKNFISESFINWRGMQESGGRRIKRSILIDQQTIRFLTDDDIERLQGFNLLEDYLEDKQKDIVSWNERLEKQGKKPLNKRRLTNIGTFRAYALQYIKNNPLIRQDMLMIVRQMAPTSEGLPLEVYCFTDTVQWVPYEAIQSDIFDHLLSIIGEFGLSVYQTPSGKDMREMGARLADSQDAF